MVATCSGSSGSGGSGRPVGTSQNWQERVQIPPRIMMVSDWRFQHSPMFGHDALSQTVCSPSSATRCLRSKKTSPCGIFIRIQSGFRSDRGRAAGGAPPSLTSVLPSSSA